ncbi:aminotransferase class IV [Spongiivirga citrea]|uniref:Aminotransferase IV n=1 Tax=Spongiivirga citrea TaxID=1481457 RepID=A0A6M0CDY3_9FLAO|nr:aminotransferase class IV [Spongiivirga citrea]NER15931.1 aminotransferase IV [Spongiivirga citrea]
MLEFNSDFPAYVSLNGEVIPTSEAKISVFDRGFNFGDGVYEGLLIVNGVILFEDAHWNRLQRSLKALDMSSDIAQLKLRIRTYLQHEEVAKNSAFLYVQISRGVAMRGHQYNKSISPTVFMYAINREVTDINETFLDTISTPDNRWHRCDIKMTSLLGNVMAKTKAINTNCYESIMVRNGLITEGSHCNAFFVKNGRVFTHPADHHILNGITRLKVVELCNELGIPFTEQAVAYSELKTMDEAFLTGTSTQIARIHKIDDHEFDINFKNSITMRVQYAYAKLKRAYIKKVR